MLDSLLHFDERDPEFMYQDVENLPDGLYSESYLSDEIWHVINSLKKFAPDRADEFAQWCDDNGAEQDYTALREFLHFKPKAERRTSEKKADTISRAELRKLIADNGGSEWLQKNASGACLFGGRLVVFSKPTIETSFCYDDENKAALETYYHFSEDTFISENLEKNRRWFFREKDKYSTKDYYITKNKDNTGNIWNLELISEYEIKMDGFSNMEYIKLTPTEVEQLRKCLDDEKEKFVARLQAYLKRYGLSKVKTWTYWANA